MAQTIGPDPGFVFREGSSQPGSVWISELIRIVNLTANAIDDLNQSISDPPTQAEVQAISDKIDAILAALRAIGKLET